MLLTPKQFSSKVLRWFEKNGRKDLPWQKNITPYRVWISEIMLQQTQVATVIPYFNRFMKQFPSLSSLANAEEDEVLHLWTGLGYYARARNLHRTARMIVSDFKGRFPKTLEDIQTLPGIGRSTAGAILSIAMKQPATILDGNVKRVLCRFAAIKGWPGSTPVLKQLWEIAERYTPASRTNEYSQAMMDLGATLCTRTQPECHRCPLSRRCLAYKQANPTDYPYSKPKKNLPIKTVRFLILQNNDGKILLEKRPPTGIWGSLWSFPECALKDDLAHLAQKYYADSIEHIRELPSFRHTFSHFHLDITPSLLSIRCDALTVRENNHRWYDATAPDKQGFPAPIKRLLESLDKIL